MNLVRIENIFEYLDKDGILKCSLFNQAGGKLANKGQVCPEKLKKMPVYTRDLISAKTAADLIDLKKEELDVNKVGHATVELYEEIYDTFRKTIIEDSLSPKNFGNIDQAVEELCKSKTVSPIQMHRCITVIRDRDNYTLHHSLSIMILMFQAIKDIAKYSVWKDELKDFFTNVEFGGETNRKYLLGSLLHDYGKAFIPRTILQKPGKLTAAERRKVREHPKKGVYELKLIGIDDERILRLVGNHHYDYLSYGVSQKPLESVVNILDIYDACRSDRPYKKAMSLKDTMKSLSIHRRGAGWPVPVLDFLYRTTISASEAFIDITEN